ncbi:hypothetical protein B0H19DRAFT_567715 [Mycena capillaripes]|nr:hypothetical protein B0H19DRAFT_567715 [Mycena capillaripes]
MVYETTFQGALAKRMSRFTSLGTSDVVAASGVPHLALERQPFATPASSARTTLFLSPTRASQMTAPSPAVHVRYFCTSATSVAPSTTFSELGEDGCSAYRNHSRCRRGSWILQLFSACRPLGLLVSLEMDFLRSCQLYALEMFPSTVHCPLTKGSKSVT